MLANDVKCSGAAFAKGGKLENRDLKALHCTCSKKAIPRGDVFGCSLRVASIGSFAGNNDVLNLLPARCARPHSLSVHIVLTKR